jgi:hypothetical protein
LVDVTGLLEVLAGCLTASVLSAVYALMSDHNLTQQQNRQQLVSLGYCLDHGVHVRATLRPACVDVTLDALR